MCTLRFLHLNLGKFRSMLYYYLFKLPLILYILHRKKDIYIKNYLIKFIKILFLYNYYILIIIILCYIIVYIGF